MLARLRRETAVCHAAADADRMAVMMNDLGVDEYRAFLTTIYGFEAPVAYALAATPSLDRWVDLRGHGSLRLLRADLVALATIDPAELPRCGDIKPLATPAAALGWLYVVERNVLVHGLIERHLREHLPRTHAVAGLYLGAQQRSTGSRWRELGEALDRCGRNLRDADQIVVAARAAFRAQHRWYQSPPTEHQRVA